MNNLYFVFLKIYNVDAATPADALATSLVGFFEKRKLRSFLIFVANYEKDKPSTYMKGKTMEQVTTKQLYDEYGLDPNTQASRFILTPKISFLFIFPLRFCCYDFSI